MKSLPPHSTPTASTLHQSANNTIESPQQHIFNVSATILISKLHIQLLPQLIDFLLDISSEGAVEGAVAHALPVCKAVRTDNVRAFVDVSSGGGVDDAVTRMALLDSIVTMTAFVVDRGDSAHGCGLSRRIVGS